MSTVTLEQIKQEHSRLAELIANFERQAIEVGHGFYLPEMSIDMLPGEHYAGIIVGQNGESSHHLILLPGDLDSVNWENARAWAAEQCGALPTRREQALLYANLKEEFKPEYYWSSEQRASDPDWAWCQYFHYGDQDRYGKDHELRARAVRRLVIE